MAKRQVESKIFEEVWFMDLPIEYKALMLYFFITSSHAGIGNLNMKLINATLDHNYNYSNILDYLNNVAIPLIDDILDQPNEEAVLPISYETH